MKKQTLGINGPIRYEFSTETIDATFTRLAIIHEKFGGLIKNISYGHSRNGYSIQMTTKRPMTLNEIMIIL